MRKLSPGPQLDPVICTHALYLSLSHTHTHTQPSEPDDTATSSTLLSTQAIIAIAASGGGVALFFLVLCCFFCCWCLCCRVSQKYEYRTGAEYRITAQYWTEGSAHYTVTRSQDSLSSRASSIRSSLGLRPKVHRSQRNEMYENQAAPQFFSTPL